ncbi:MAG: RluA family pseudouridine synthase [Oscillospiraceae bacterium]|jgi:23S rRNA pseudouridine955/2504/2580 synthase|nr:RluA family pseudouridine synthase [Oscillospiraceae bacterium]
MKNIKINLNDAKQRLDSFLKKVVPRLPHALLYKYIRKKRIKINDRRCEISERLNFGDVINLYINDEFFSEKTNKLDFLNAGSQLNILYEDKNILITDKNPGLIVHPDKNLQFDCLINRIKKYLYLKNEYSPDLENNFSPSLVNRIDRNTGGIVISAKNFQSLKILNEALKLRHIKKYYLCVICGKMPKKEDILKDFLKKDKYNNKVAIYNDNNYKDKYIKTKYKVIKEKNNLSLVEIDLLTGRTHQIRAHLSSIGCPILGDQKYGDSNINKTYGYKYQLLYSYKIEFDENYDFKDLNYLKGKSFKIFNPWFLKDFDFRFS